MPKPLSSNRRRAYATALGFYMGDRVWVAELEACGYVSTVAGPDSHAVTVRMDYGHVVPLEDFDLTRTI